MQRAARGDDARLNTPIELSGCGEAHKQGQSDLTLIVGLTRSDSAEWGIYSKHRGCIKLFKTLCPSKQVDNDFLNTSIKHHVGRN